MRAALLALAVTFAAVYVLADLAADLLRGLGS